MTDHYLSKVPIQREMLQLIGSTAMLIASKFEVSLNHRNIHLYDYQNQSSGHLDLLRNQKKEKEELL